VVVVGGVGGGSEVEEGERERQECHGGDVDREKLTFGLCAASLQERYDDRSSPYYKNSSSKVHDVPFELLSDCSWVWTSLDEHFFCCCMENRFEWTSL